MAEDTETSVAPTTEIPIDSIVEKYIALRDKKAEMKAAYDGSVAKIDDGMNRCEAFLLATLEKIGGDSIKTKFGTAYKTTKTGARVDDWKQVLGFIKEGEHWSMLNQAVSKKFVEAWKDEHNDLPPGISWYAETALNVKRNS